MLVIDDLINAAANVVSTLLQLMFTAFTMMPRELQLLIGVALVSFMLLVFQAGLFGMCAYGVAPAQAVRDALTIRNVCDEANTSCHPEYSPMVLNTNSNVTLSRLETNGSSLQASLDSCIADYKPRDQWALLFTCACNASSYHALAQYMGDPGINCTGLQNGYIFTSCSQIGNACMVTIAGQANDRYTESVNTGFYMLNPVFWSLVGILLPVGSLALRVYSSTGVWDIIFKTR